MFFSVRFCPLCFLVSQFVVSLLLFSRLLIIFLSLRLFLPFLSLFSSSYIPYYPHILVSSPLVFFSALSCPLVFFFGFSILLFSWVPSVLNFFAWFSSLVSLLSSLLVVCRRFAEDAKEQVWAETPHLRQRIANFTIQAIAGNRSGESRPAVYRRHCPTFLACVFSSSML